MLLVWGHNNFRLKAVSPIEIGIINPTFQGMQFELRQKYGHLFWIPFIPLGQIWVTKKSDGRLYNCPDEIEKLLRDRYPSKGSIWAWTGPLLIIAGVIIAGISEKVQTSNRQQEYAQSYTESNTLLSKQVGDIQQNDYLVFNIKEGAAKYYDYKNIPLKVVRVNKEVVTLGTIYTSLESTESMNELSKLPYAEMMNGILDTFTVTKSSLEKSVCKKHDEESTFPGITLPKINGSTQWKLKEIHHIEGPMLKELSLDESKKGDSHYYELENKGFPAEADSIVSITPGIEWALSKKRRLDIQDTIALKASGNGTALLYCHDAQKKEYTIKIKNGSYRLAIESEYIK